MFALFFSLYLGMFLGRWPGLFSFGNIRQMCATSINGIGEFVSSLFNGVTSPMTTLGDILMTNTSIYNQDYPNYMTLISLILTTITCIGIVVVVTKGIKKLFTVFFYGVR